MLKRVLNSLEKLFFFSFCFYFGFYMPPSKTDTYRIHSFYRVFASPFKDIHCSSRKRSKKLKKNNGNKKNEKELMLDKKKITKEYRTLKWSFPLMMAYINLPFLTRVNLNLPNKTYDVAFKPSEKQKKRKLIVIRYV